MWFTMLLSVLAGLIIIIKTLNVEGLVMEVPKSVETRKHPCSKTEDYGMQQQRFAILSSEVFLIQLQIQSRYAYINVAT